MVVTRIYALIGTCEDPVNRYLLAALAADAQVAAMDVCGLATEPAQVGVRVTFTPGHEAPGFRGLAGQLEPFDTARHPQVEVTRPSTWDRLQEPDDIG